MWRPPILCLLLVVAAFAVVTPPIAVRSQDAPQETIDGPAPAAPGEAESPAGEEPAPEPLEFDDETPLTGKESIGVNLFPFYARTRDRETGEHSTMAAFWIYWRTSQGFDVAPDEPLPTDEAARDVRKRSTWLLPFYFKNENRDDFWTVAPIPFYFGFGKVDDWFAAALPLYWSAHQDLPEIDSQAGWQVLFPFYWHFYDPGEREWWLLPFTIDRSLPGERQTWVLPPLYAHSSYTDIAGEDAGTGHSLLWPLIEIEDRDEGYEYRFLPFGSVSRHGDARSLLITPFYYESSDPTGSFYWAFPFHSRFETVDEQRDYWAAGIYNTARTVDEEGSIVRSRDDWLWSLASFQENRRTGEVHERVLPLGYWHTETDVHTTSLGGPLFYSSRRLDADENLHSLDLILGNVWVSSRVEAPPNGGPPSVSDDATNDADGAGDSDNAAIVHSAVPPADGAGAEAGAESIDSAAVAAIATEPHLRSSEQGLLYPLTRWYRDDVGNEGHWVAPFYFNTETDTSHKLAAWPLAYQQADISNYELNYFRYFFLFNHETWASGSRLSVAQLLFDWYSEDAEDRQHVSFLYPLFEVDSSRTRTEFHFDQILGAEIREEGGERIDAYRLFPIFWLGGRDRLSAAGEWVPQERHFYLFPFYGYEARTTKVDYHVLYPLLHVQRATESTTFELWPMLFFSSNPTRNAWAVWPFHAHESGEGADDTWVERFFFLSKYSQGPGRGAWRLDPFLWSYSWDDAVGISEFALPFSLYKQRTEGASTRRTLFWFINF